MRRRITGLALEVSVPLAAVGVWAVWTAHQQSYYFPPVSQILRSFHQNWLFARFGGDVAPSLERLALGFAIAVAVGVACGLLLGLSRWAHRAAAPIVEFLRAIPAPAMLPLGILVLGVGASMKVFVIALASLWPVLLNTIDGVTGIDTTFEETARAYRISGSDRLKLVTRAASPQIFAGVRTSLSLALILMVISEMVASTNGIGFFVLQAQRSFAIADMWSGIVLLGLLGYTLSGVLVLVERRSLRWHRGLRASALT